MAAHSPLDLSTAMSRFFRSASDSESDTESDESFISDEELSSEEEEFSEEEEEQIQDQQPKKSRFLKGVGTDSEEESDEEEGQKRQVKSQKDKRLDEIQNSARLIENGLKNNDWGLISNGMHGNTERYAAEPLIESVYRIRQVDYWRHQGHHWL